MNVNIMDCPKIVLLIGFDVSAIDPKIITYFNFSLDRGLY